MEAHMIIFVVGSDKIAANVSPQGYLAQNESHGVICSHVGNPLWKRVWVQLCQEIKVFANKLYTNLK